MDSMADRTPAAAAACIRAALPHVTAGSIATAPAPLLPCGHGGAALPLQRRAGAGPERLGAAVVAAGLVVAGRRQRGALQPRRAAPQGAVDGVMAPVQEAQSGRKVCIEFEGNMEVILPRGTMASMDAFMKENAATVCLQNVERIEVAPQDPEAKHLYLEPNDMGPYRSQMRLTVKVDVGDSGRCDINILEMEPGNVDKKTGELTFDPANRPDFKTQNTVTWEENSVGGLKVINRSTARSVTTLPWWFPLPDALVQKLAQFFISKVISTGMKKVNEQIEKQYAAYLTR